MYPAICIYFHTNIPDSIGHYTQILMHISRYVHGWGAESITVVLDSQFQFLV